MAVSVRALALAEFAHILTKNVIFLDTETSGLNGHAQIIEIALTDKYNKTLVKHRVKPEYDRIASGAFRSHHISGWDLMDAPRWPTVWKDVEPHLIKADHIVCYNAPFDQ